MRRTGKESGNGGAGAGLLLVPEFAAWMGESRRESIRRFTYLAEPQHAAVLSSPDPDEPFPFEDVVMRAGFALKVSRTDGGKQIIIDFEVPGEVQILYIVLGRITLGLGGGNERQSVDCVACGGGGGGGWLGVKMVGVSHGNR
jgi:hypothetical protein